PSTIHLMRVRSSVTSTTAPSAKVAKAWNWMVSPDDTAEADTGLSTIEVMTSPDTVTFWKTVTPPTVAERLAVPSARAFTVPLATTRTIGLADVTTAASCDKQYIAPPENVPAA